MALRRYDPVSGLQEITELRKFETALPASYQELEYIENTASTMVDTGIACSDNMEFFIRTKCATLDSYYILQRRSSQVTGINGLSGSQSGATLLLSFNGTNVTSDIRRIVGHVYSIKGVVNNGNLTLIVNDETAGTSATNTGSYTIETLPSDNVTFFGNNKGDRLTSGEQVYEAYIKKDDVLVWNMIPAKRTSDSAVGVYNTANNTFTLPTSGSLIAGPQKSTPTMMLKKIGEVYVKINGVLQRVFTSRT